MGLYPEFERTSASSARRLPAARRRVRDAAQSRTASGSGGRSGSASSCGRRGHGHRADRPALRGSGVKWDVRKACPTRPTTTSISRSRSARTATPTTGTSSASKRCASRIRIIQQALERTARGTGHGQDAEGHQAAGRRGLHSIESPKGELGMYLVSDGTTQPYRLRCRPPCFINLQALRADVRSAIWSPTSSRSSARSTSCSARWTGKLYDD